jgi:glutamate synthase (NADPH/NADH) small chain
VDIERVGKGPNGERRIEAVPGSERTFPADIVLLAIGYNGAEHPVVNTFGLNVDGRGNVTASDDYQTSVQGVFAAGDARRGQSLIVWAIAEGREAARGVDEYLTGKSRLPLTHVVE